MASKNLDVEIIHKAFSPARSIQSPNLFVGRIQEIKDCASALLNEASFIVIYGQRGVGKSSIGHQLKLIAEGDLTLARMFAFDQLIPKNGFNDLVLYFQCDKFINDIPNLITRIMFGDDINPSIFSLTKTGNRKIEDFKKSIEGNLSINIAGIKVGSKGGTNKSYSTEHSEDIIQKFRQFLGLVRKDIQYKYKGLLILVDEFDIIQNKTGWSSIVKACSSDFVRFGIIGIGANISELVKDHESISRQIEAIKVPLMNIYDLFEILKKAEFLVDHTITFDDDSAHEIISKSEGFPHFTHLLGKEAMLSAFLRSSTKVTLEDIKAVSNKISNGKLTTIYEDLYHSAVKNSAYREILIKSLADSPEEEIYLLPIFRLCLDFGIKRPDAVMKQILEDLDSKGIIKTLRENYIRFSDPIFKVYAKVRNWKF